MQHISRRTLIRRGATLGLVAAGSLGAVPTLSGRPSPPVGAASPGGTSVAAGQFTRPLPIPAVLTGPNIILTAKPSQIAILPGQPTTMWTYNGTFPGPTIRRPAGERTTVTLEHDLPPAPAGVHPDNTLTLHHHGAHSASEHDGIPLPGHVIEPGASRTYVYEHMEDSIPERAAMQWYHDHTHHRTSFNAFMGLGGLFILDDEHEASLPLPRDAYEVPLFLTDRSFTEDNQLATAVYGAPGNREVRGRTVLVNGAVEPYLDVEPRRYRLRAHNGAGFSLYNLKLARTESGIPSDAASAEAVPLLQIGTESGLLPAAVERAEISLGPAERADLIVDFSELAGETLVLANVGPRDRSREIAGLGGQTPPALAGDTIIAALFMQIRVGTVVTEPDPGPLPSELRALPDWVSELPRDPSRVFVFGQGVDPANPTALPHTINGRAFDHARVDAQPELDAVESWMLVNASNQSHWIHLHNVDWFVVSRNLTAPAPHEAGLKETFKLDPGEVLIIGTKFTDHLGAYMTHCHMLDHEDSGMMTRWDVVEAGDGSATTMTRAERLRTDQLLAAVASNPGAPAPAALVQALASTVVVDTAGSPYLCDLNGLTDLT